MKCLITALVLVTFILFAAPSQAAKVVSRPLSNISQDLSDLIRFAQHNIDQDPRSALLTPQQRFTAMLESLLLYGIRFPEPSRLKAHMSPSAMARVLLSTTPLRQRSLLTANISDLVQTLRPVLQSIATKARRAKLTKVSTFTGHGD